MASMAPIVVPATRSVPHTATIIFLHGLGDTGAGWKQVAQMLSQQAPHIKWILPTAPSRPVTINRGAVMPAWFDIVALPAVGADEPEVVAGVRASAQVVENLIDAEVASGVPEDRIIIGGFSQGGSTALYSSLTTKYKLAGTIALSARLPDRDSFTSISDTAKKGRYFFGHGEEDQVVLHAVGRAACNKLNELGVPQAAELGAEGRGTSFNSYSGMRHEADPRELRDLLAWILRAVPPSTV